MLQLIKFGRKGPRRKSSARVVMLLAFPLTEKGGINTFARNLIDALEAECEITPLLVVSERFIARAGQRVGQLETAARHVLELVRLKPDVIHTHEHPALLAAAVVYRMLSRRAVRVVHTIHVHPIERRGLWKRLVLGWMLRRCWTVTVVARATADRLNMIATPVPTDVTITHGAARVYPCARSDAQVAALKQTLHIGNGPTICQISPLNLTAKVAGVVRLLEATALIRQRIPTIRLLVVGDGDLRSQVELMARDLRVDDCTYFTGAVDDISVALEVADVYCQITLQDACPLSLLEAMAFGKPVVASRTGGIPEVVTDGVDGILVDSDPREIADRVMELLADPQAAQELGARARLTLQTRFTWKRVARGFAAAYGFEPLSHLQPDEEPVHAAAFGRAWDSAGVGSVR